MQTLGLYVLWFLFYSVVGWIYESTVCSIQQKRWVNRGFLNGPWIPIYGSGALLVILLFYRQPPIPIFPLFILCGVMDCTLEYITSWAMEKLFHARWWDYSNMRFHINGRVCLLGFCAFGVLSVVLLWWIHPALAAFTGRIPLGILWIADGIFLLLFLTDLAVTVRTVVALDQKLAELQQRIEEERQKAAAKFRVYREELEDRLEDLGDQIDRVQEKIRDSRHNADLESYRQQMEDRIAALLERLRESEPGDESRLEQLQQLWEQKRRQLMQLSRLPDEPLRFWGDKPPKTHRFWQKIQRRTQFRLMRAFPHLNANERSEALESVRKQLTLEKSGHRFKLVKKSAGLDAKAASKDSSLDEK
jgi:uncharacterized membrane protein